MRENYTTDAINLKSYNLSESDKIILMYSRDKGLIKGVAKGVKKTKSKLGGRMESFVANKLLLNKGKNLDTICQAEAINTFSNLRNNMDKLIYSSYIAEVVSIFGYENDVNSEEVYDIFYKTLNKIANSQDKISILMNVIRYQLKIMRIFGYELSLSNCVHCGCKIDEEKTLFSTNMGGVLCNKCAQNNFGLTTFPNKIKVFLCELLKLDIEEKSQYDDIVNERVCEVCFNLLKNYIQSRSEKEFKTVKMLEMV